MKCSDELDRFFALSGNLACIVDFRWRFLVLNSSWERTLGYSREELLSRRCIDFVHPDDWERTLTETAPLTRESTSVSFNGATAVFTVVSGTEIAATVPVGATTGFVTVTTPSGVLTSNKQFRVIP